MRTLLILVVIGALGFLGYTYQEEIKERYHKVVNKSETAEPSDDAASRSDRQVPPPVAGTAPATPAQKRTAPPGVYYMTQRISVQVDSGVKALVPGEMVKLVYRNKNGTVKVTTGGEDFVVKETQITNDIDTAERARSMGGLPPSKLAS
ncbi:MAG: hypothetical protein JWQ44_1003 [Chthoniobacter sp.]|jgi:hypothetical protein|nr:hypothetical protein [Chthoniobacter sp.]